MTRDDSENLLGDLIDAQLRYLRGEGPEPSLADLPNGDRTEAQRLLQLVDALADSLPAPPPMAEDPVAIQLGLVEASGGSVWPLRSTDPIMMSVQELSYRLGGAIDAEVASYRAPDDSCGGLICRSLAEVVFVVVVSDAGELPTSRHARPIFHDYPELSAVAFCSPDATRASVVTYAEAVDRLIPARSWVTPAVLAWEPLGIALGRHFDRSIPRWEEVSRLETSNSLEDLSADILSVVDVEIKRVARLRPRLHHKRHARDFVASIDKMHFEDWVAAVRAHRLSGEQLDAEITDLCQAVMS